MTGHASWRVAALLLVLGSIPRVAAEPARRALVIGIEDYSASKLRGVPSPVRRNWYNLNAAVDDAEAMRVVLMKKYGFAARDIVLLTNQQATRKAIVDAITTHLIQPSRSGDIAVFYFAGHGARVPNPLSTEPDKMDESIVPADSRVGALDIRDKDLRRLFNRIVDRGAKLTVILDNCNSASGARGLLTGARVRGLRPDTRAVADAPDKSPAPEDRGALIIAATQDDELARETIIDGVDRGVFSWAFLRAIHASDENEPAIETFRRAQAILRGQAEDQQPVISGTDEVRLSPLFRTGPHQKSRDLFVVEKVRTGGRVTLQGGWAHGLTIGSELVTGDRKIRLEITAMDGLDRCEARIVSSPAPIEPGTSLEIASWAAPPTRPLRVWMPQTKDAEGVRRRARELAGLASRKNIRWIADPTEETPSHVLRIRGTSWELLTRDGRIDRFKAISAAVARIPSKSLLFVQLPVPAAVIRALEIGPGTGREAIEPVTGPEHADFVLTGRLADGNVSYAWVRPLASSSTSSVLPARTKWYEAKDTLALRYAVTRLRRIQAWQMLESPATTAYAYGLAFRQSRDDAPVRDARVVGAETYKLVLRPHPSRTADQRFVYAFMIDRDGKGVLLFPLRGSVENRFPLRPGKVAPADIVLDGSFEVTKPYGLETYFLLSTDEPLSDPWILEWDGVRGGLTARTPLEELLIQTSGLRRSTQPIRIPSRWSIERVLLESVPPKR